MSASSASGPNGSKTTVPARIGRFVLKECLGGGGFGIVFRAYDP